MKSKLNTTKNKTEEMADTKKAEADFWQEAHDLRSKIEADNLQEAYRILRKIEADLWQEAYRMLRNIEDGD